MQIVVTDHLSDPLYADDFLGPCARHAGDLTAHLKFKLSGRYMPVDRTQPGALILAEARRHKIEEVDKNRHVLADVQDCGADGIEFPLRDVGDSIAPFGGRTTWDLFLIRHVQHASPS